MEEWRDIKGFEGKYQVSSTGRVKSLDRFIHSNDGSKDWRLGRILKPWKNDKGYLIVRFTYGGKSVRVHRLVAEAFLQNPGNKRTVNHLDSNRRNNFVSNLEWATDSENLRHGFTHNDVKKKGESGFRGVYRYKRSNKWVASVQLNKKRYRLGCFKTPLEAHLVYAQAVHKYLTTKETP